MRILAVEYDDGRMYVHTDRDTLEYPYVPAILIDPRIVKYLSETVSGVRHPHALEVRGGIDYLIDLQREVSKLTNAFLFIEPERQFLLERGLSIGSQIVDGMPSFRLPLFDSWRDALTFLLRTRRGPAARTFLENIFYNARVAADLSVVDRLRLPPEALRIVLDLNIDPTTIGSGDVALPASRVRVSTDLPFTYLTTDPVLRKRLGGAIPVRDGGILPLADAEILGLEYELVAPIPVSSTPGIIQRGLNDLLALFRKMLSRIRVRGKSIEDYALRSSSSEVVSAYSYLEAISHIILPLSSFFASSNALTPIGRVNYLTGWELYRREPNAYKRLYASNSICSHVSSELEYFLLVLSNLPLELPRWWRFKRA